MMEPTQAWTTRLHVGMWHGGREKSPRISLSVKSKDYQRQTLEHAEQRSRVIRKPALRALRRVGPLQVADFVRLCVDSRPSQVFSRWFFGLEMAS